MATVDKLATVDNVHAPADTLSAAEPRPFDVPSQRKTPSPISPAAKMATVASMTTVDPLPVLTERHPPDPRSAIDLKGRTVNSKLCKPASLVQHGHTPGEHAIYMALWNLGGTPDRRDQFRDVTIGYDRLAAVLGGSKRNVQRLLESLLQKFAIEVLRAEDSGIRQGKMYRVYSMTEILRRRRDAGYTWVLRNRSAVELIKMTTVDTLATADNQSTVAMMPTVASKTTDTVAKLTTDTVDSLTTPLGSSVGITQETSSSSQCSPLIDRVRKTGIFLDDDAARRIISRCQGADHTATVEEIAYFAELKIHQLAKRRNIENWPGLLMAAIPPYFDPPATELCRYRMELERSRQVEQRHEIDTAEAILADQSEPESSKDWAREILRKWKTGTTTGNSSLSPDRED